MEKLQVLTREVCLDPSRVEAIVKVAETNSVVIMLHSGATIPLAYETMQQMDEQHIALVNGINETNANARFTGGDA